MSHSLLSRGDRLHEHVDSSEGNDHREKCLEQKCQRQFRRTVNKLEDERERKVVVVDNAQDGSEGEYVRSWARARCAKRGWFGRYRGGGWLIPSRKTVISILMPWVDAVSISVGKHEAIN